MHRKILNGFLILACAALAAFAVFLVPVVLSAGGLPIAFPLFILFLMSALGAAWAYSGIKGETR